HRLIGHVSRGGERHTGISGDLLHQLAERDLRLRVADRLVESLDTGQGRAMRRSRLRREAGPAEGEKADEKSRPPQPPVVHTSHPPAFTPQAAPGERLKKAPR